MWQDTGGRGLTVIRTVYVLLVLLYISARADRHQSDSTFEAAHQTAAPADH